MNGRRARVSIVVPVYFNAATLPAMAERLRTAARDADWDIEVLFEDDGSGDDSWAKISEIASAWRQARGVRLTRNFGSQMAIVAGLQESTGDAAAVLSADLQEPPELLAELICAWRCGSTPFSPCARPGPSRGRRGPPPGSIIAP